MLIMRLSLFLLITIATGIKGKSLPKQQPTPCKGIQSPGGTGHETDPFCTNLPNQVDETRQAFVPTPSVSGRSTVASVNTKLDYTGVNFTTIPSTHETDTGLSNHKTDVNFTTNLSTHKTDVNFTKNLLTHETGINFTTSLSTYKTNVNFTSNAFPQTFANNAKSLSTEHTDVSFTCVPNNRISVNYTAGVASTETSLVSIPFSTMSADSSIASEVPGPTSTSSADRYPDSSVPGTVATSSSPEYSDLHPSDTSSVVTSSHSDHSNCLLSGADAISTSFVIDVSDRNSFIPSSVITRSSPVYSNTHFSETGSITAKSLSDYSEMHSSNPESIDSSFSTLYSDSHPLDTSSIASSFAPEYSDRQSSDLRSITTRSSPVYSDTYSPDTGLITTRSSPSYPNTIPSQTGSISFSSAHGYSDIHSSDIASVAPSSTLVGLDKTSTAPSFNTATVSSSEYRGTIHNSNKLSTSLKLTTANQFQTSTTPRDSIIVATKVYETDSKKHTENPPQATEHPVETNLDQNYDPPEKRATPPGVVAAAVISSIGVAALVIGAFLLHRKYKKNKVVPSPRITTPVEGMRNSVAPAPTASL